MSSLGKYCLMVNSVEDLRKSAMYVTMSSFYYYLPLEKKDMPFVLTTLSNPCSRMRGAIFFVIVTIFCREKIINHQCFFFTLSLLSPLRKARAPSFEDM